MRTRETMVALPAARAAAAERIRQHACYPSRCTAARQCQKEVLRQGVTVKVKEKARANEKVRESVPMCEGQALGEIRMMKGWEKKRRRKRPRTGASVSTSARWHGSQGCVHAAVQDAPATSHRQGRLRAREKKKKKKKTNKPHSMNFDLWDWRVANEPAEAIAACVVDEGKEAGTDWKCPNCEGSNIIDERGNGAAWFRSREGSLDTHTHTRWTKQALSELARKSAKQSVENGQTRSRTDVAGIQRSAAVKGRLPRAPAWPRSEPAAPCDDGGAVAYRGLRQRQHLQQRRWKRKRTRQRRKRAKGTRRGRRAQAQTRSPELAMWGPGRRRAPVAEAVAAMRRSEGKQAGWWSRHDITYIIEQQQESERSEPVAIGMSPRHRSRKSRSRRRWLLMLLLLLVRLPLSPQKRWLLRAVGDARERLAPAPPEVHD